MIWIGVDWLLGMGWGGRRRRGGGVEMGEGGSGGMLWGGGFFTAFIEEKASGWDSWMILPGIPGILEMI